MGNWHFAPPFITPEIEGRGKGEGRAGLSGVDGFAKTLKSRPSPAGGKALCICTESSDVTVDLGTEAKVRFFFFLRPCNPFYRDGIGATEWS